MIAGRGRRAVFVASGYTGDAGRARLSGDVGCGLWPIRSPNQRGRLLHRPILLRRLLLGLTTFLAPLVVVAQPLPDGLQAALDDMAGPEAEISVRPSAVDGLYEVVHGADVFYMTGDGRYMVAGPLLEAATGRNLTEASESQARLVIVQKLPEDSLIVFAPPQPKHQVTVFTDIDCHFCREMHKQVEAYNARGIAVRYAAFPRAGLTSPSAQKARHVWCATDPHEAMTRAKRGEEVAAATCDDPVREHMQAVEALNLNGTPSIVLDDGRLVPGFVPPAELLQILDSPS